MCKQVSLTNVSFYTNFKHNFTFFSISTSTHQIRFNSATHNWAGKVVNIDLIVVHELFTPRQLSNNIALIRIRGTLFPAFITESVALRCPKTERDEEKLLVAGWGWILDKWGQLSVNLRQVMLPYAGDSCAQFYDSVLGKKVDSELMFCAGDLDHGGAGICKGDEGGAAVKKVTDGNGTTKAVITGIAAYVDACGQPKLISLFTRVGSYIDWISSVTGYVPSCLE